MATLNCVNCPRNSPKFRAIGPRYFQEFSVWVRNVLKELLVLLKGAKLVVNAGVSGDPA